MVNHARVLLEKALRERRLDRTLTSALPAPDRSTTMETGVEAVDRALQGGFPQGHLSEVAGPASSGRLTLALQAVAGATTRGELAAFIDTCDGLDVPSVVAAGIVLERLLWVRGQACPVTLAERALERALKACALIVQAGGFGLIVLDLADVPMPVLRRLPPATWLRLQRALEGRDTACVLLVQEPLARSPGGCTITMTARAAWHGEAACSRLLAGVTLAGRVVSARRRTAGDIAVSAYMPEAAGLLDMSAGGLAFPVGQSPVCRQAGYQTAHQQTG